jgi:hypothetical protein
MQRMCEQVAVPGVDEATLTLLTDGAPVTAATTSDIAAALDRDQYAAGDGPCLQAARTGDLVGVSVTEVADRWPMFVRDADAAGFGSFLSAPLAVQDGHTGAINCYRARGHGFAELDEKLLDLYTSAATALGQQLRKSASVAAHDLGVVLVPTSARQVQVRAGEGFTQCGSYSTPTARRPAPMATTSVVPDPAIGSNTSSPGRV